MNIDNIIAFHYIISSGILKISSSDPDGFQHSHIYILIFPSTDYHGGRRLEVPHLQHGRRAGISRGTFQVGTIEHLHGINVVSENVFTDFLPLSMAEPPLEKMIYSENISDSMLAKLSLVWATCTRRA